MTIHIGKQNLKKKSKVFPLYVVKELVSELIAVQPGQQKAVMQVGRSQYQHT